MDAAALAWSPIVGLLAAILTVSFYIPLAAFYVPPDVAIILALVAISWIRGFKATNPRDRDQREDDGNIGWHIKRGERNVETNCQNRREKADDRRPRQRCSIHGMLSETRNSKTGKMVDSRKKRIHAGPRLSCGQDFLRRYASQLVDAKDSFFDQIVRARRPCRNANGCRATRQPVTCYNLALFV